MYGRALYVLVYESGREDHVGEIIQDLERSFWSPRQLQPEVRHFGDAKRKRKPVRTDDRESHSYLEPFSVCLENESSRRRWNAIANDASNEPYLVEEKETPFLCWKEDTIST